MTIKRKLLKKLTQHDIVCRLMFVSLDMTIYEAGKSLLERSQIRIVSLSTKK